MTMFPVASSSNDHSAEKISSADLAYFQDRLRSRLYDLVLTEFENAREIGLTQAMLARRLGKRPEQINRWLSSPGNWTLETVSNLLIGISNSELMMSVESIRKNNGVVIDGAISSDPLAQNNSFANQFLIEGAAVPQISYNQALVIAVYTPS